MEGKAKTKVRKMYVCLCGFEFIPKTISTKDVGGRFYLSEPVSCYLFDTEEGWVLFDTGFNRDVITDPALEDKYFTSRGWIPTPVSDEQHDLSVQLASIGLTYDDISTIIISHLHADHTGNIAKCKNAKVYIQRAEYDFGFADETPPPWFECDYKEGVEIDWVIKEGDFTLMDGLKVIDTKGHTPGHQSVIVTLPESGVFVLTADAGDLAENYEKEIPCGENIGDDIAIEAIRRLKREAKDLNGILFLGHDIDWVKQIKLIPEYYS